MTASAIRTERWRPPKPLVGQRALEKVLNRHTAVNCPESRLLVAVISAAIVDCLSLGKGVRHEARRFVLGPDLGCIKGSGSFNSPNPSTGFLLAMARTCTWVNRIRW